MLQKLSFPFRLFTFWLIFFAAFRLWFVLWFREKWSHEAPGSIWAAFGHGLPLDFSTAGYLLVLPLLLWILGVSSSEIWQNRLSKAIFWVNATLICVSALIFGANVFIYEEWQTLLNNRAFEYMRSPRALFDSMSGLFLVVAVLLYAGLCWFWLKIYGFAVGLKAFRGPAPKWALFFGPAFLACAGVFIRGGTDKLPINESRVYYSAHLFNNHAATNVAWHFLHSLVEVRANKNPFVFFEKGKALEMAANLLETKELPSEIRPAIFDSLPPKPNVVLIIMESMTAQVLEELAHVQRKYGPHDLEKGVCPNLSRLAREGFLFENCYGSGYRTDQGLVSVLSGYPAQPDQSVVLLEDKASKLPSLPRVFKDLGYSTAYFYGGELTFANIGVYLANQGFEKIVSERDFSKAEKTQRWGADDRILLQRAVADISKMPQPFFATAMTLSLHPPYDVDFQSPWSGSSDPREQFLNTAAFADDAIGRFFSVAEKTAWYANTLFVLVADHGAPLPGRVRMDSPPARHVPLLFFSPTAKKANASAWRSDVFGNHHDIAATLLGGLGLEAEAKKFAWSRNLFEWDALHKSRSSGGGNAPDFRGYAYYTNEDGLGWINVGGAGFYNFGSGQWKFYGGELEAASQDEAKAWLQAFYDDFLAL